MGTAGGPAARRAAPPPVVNLDNATEWSLGALRETLAAVSVLPVLTVVVIFLVTNIGRNVGLPPYACIAVGGWGCILAPLLLGFCPALSWFLLSLKKGPVVVRLSGGLSATEVVLPVGTQILILQILLLLWANNYFPELVDSAGVTFGFLAMMWPMALYALLLLYCFLPRTRGFLLLTDAQATKSPTSRVPGALWGLGVCGVALAALALQASLWSIGGDKAAQWNPFFVTECAAVIAVGFVEVLVLLAIPAKREAAS